MWVYHSPIGDLFIKKLSDNRYGLFYDNTVWMASSDIDAIVNNVYVQSSGCFEWDSYSGNADIPSHISEWEKI